MQIIYQNESWKEKIHSILVSRLVMPDDGEISNQGHSCNGKRVENAWHYLEEVVALSLKVSRTSNFDYWICQKSAGEPWPLRLMHNVS